MLLLAPAVAKYEYEMSFPMQSSATVATCVFPVRAASCRGAKMISASGNLGSLCRIAKRAVCADCATTLFLLLLIVSSEETTNLSELIVVSAVLMAVVAPFLTGTWPEDTALASAYSQRPARACQAGLSDL